MTSTDHRLTWNHSWTSRAVRAGTVLGASLGLATYVVLLARAPVLSPGQVLGGLVVEGGLATYLGGALGMLSAVVAVVCVGLVSLVRPLGRVEASVLAALAAAAPVVAITHDSPSIAIATGLAATFCAIATTPWVLGTSWTRL